jgi:RNA polymerase sigma-70 factor (family 1)
MAALKNHSDQDLLKLLKNGDHDAFTEIYERYWNKLLAIGFNHTKDKFLAEEIVQDIFVSIWNRKSEIEIDNLSAYLATAAKFSVFKYLKREFSKKQLTEKNYQRPVLSFENEQIEARFLEEYINGIVEQLPDKCRVVFKYSRADGLSNSEISKQMNIAEKTVEAHLTKGIKIIKLRLKNSGTLLIVLFHCVSSQ